MNDQAPPADDPSRPRASAAAWAGHLLMLAAMTVVGLIGCGLAAMVVWVSGAVWREVRRAVAWSAIDAWWMVPLFLAVAAFSFAIPVACAVGVYRRARRGPAPPPPGDEAGNLKGAVVRRGRGLMLAGMCLPLVGFCLWIVYVLFGAWWRGAFVPAEAAAEPFAWALLGVYSLMVFASAAGLVSAARTVLRPGQGPPPGGTWDRNAPPDD